MYIFYVYNIIWIFSNNFRVEGGNTSFVYTTDYDLVPATRDYISLYRFVTGIN